MLNANKSSFVIGFVLSSAPSKLRTRRGSLLHEDIINVTAIGNGIANLIPFSSI